MRWLDAVLVALADAPAVALLALALGLGARFSARVEVWAGAAAVVGAVAAGWLSTVSGVGSVANAAIVVPGIFAGTYLLGALVTTRQEIATDPTRLFTASALAAIAVVALVVMWRGDASVGPAQGGRTIELFGGPSIASDSIVTAVVALVAVSALALLVTVSRFRVRLAVMDRAPELLQRAGHDARHVSAMFGALNAAAAGLAGILLARQSAVAPSSALALTVLGAEAAVLGGLGSIPGALGAATVLSLVMSLGDEYRAGWGALAAHLVVLTVLVLRQGVAGPWSQPRRVEVAR